MILLHRQEHTHEIFTEKIGYTLCMGWIYYKSSTIVKQLFENILNKDIQVEI